jgi:hypothetical protein
MRWRYAIGEAIVAIRKIPKWSAAGVRFLPPEHEGQNAPGKKRAGCVRGVGFAASHDHGDEEQYWAIILYDKQADELAVLDVFPLPITPRKKEAMRKANPAS